MNASATLSETLNGFDMSASVKLSIISGLIELGGGSASYLKKQKNTRGECSVQVKCFYKTGYKEMSMDQLTQISYLDVARTGHNNRATHFVMKIQYGAGAIFTFTKQFQSGEEEWQAKAKAELNICGKTITSLLDGSLAGNYRNSSSSSQIQCEFKSYGFSLTEASPTTYDEALKFASNFGRMAHQSMARHGGEALGVPCIVWLHPLVALPGCANAPKLHCDFTLDQACKWIKFFEDCDEFERKLNVPLPIPSLPKGNKDLEKMYRIQANIRWPEKKKECREKTELVTRLRSDGLTELREMIVQIRSGLITFDHFNQKTSSITKPLDSVAGWIANEVEFFRFIMHLRYLGA
ncbi:uncharacterized protein LOC124347582 isoform X3 [Daphnia pulicaria]|nr:uncharacterized protein LOC124347582 isoform X3 [Daphnia pulicaria]